MKCTRKIAKHTRGTIGATEGMEREAESEKSAERGKERGGSVPERKKKTIFAPQAPLEESATTEASRRCSLTGILAGFQDGFGDSFLRHLRAVSGF